MQSVLSEFAKNGVSANVGLNGKIAIWLVKKPSHGAEQVPGTAFSMLFLHLQVIYSVMRNCLCKSKCDIFIFSFKKLKDGN